MPIHEESSTFSSPDHDSPLYENVAEITGLFSPKSPKKGNVISISDFLKSVPPPPPIYEDPSSNEFKYFQSEPEKTLDGFSLTSSPSSSPTSTSTPTASSPTATVSSSASSRRQILASRSSGHALQSEKTKSCATRRLDIRPLSLPHKEMQRIEREQSHRSVDSCSIESNCAFVDHDFLSTTTRIPSYYAFVPSCSARVLIITLLLITIIILLISCTIFFFYDTIEQHLSSISENF